MAMALGLGFSSPPAVAGYGGLVLDRSGRDPRSRRVIVRALNEDEAQITSIRELADGSILISFGAPQPLAVKDVPKARTLPPRPPSRYSKQFPYTPKRTKEYTGIELALVVPNSVEKKRPVRVPSTFSKKSPISKPANDRHGGNGHLVVPDSVLAFKDVDVEEDMLHHGSVKINRPRTAFARKSPIPEAAKRDTVSGKALKDLAVEEPASDTVTGEEESKGASPSTISRPATSFIRKSPIVHGRVRRRRYPKASEQSPGSVQLCSLDVPQGNLSTISRPTSTFTRKSPIIPSKDGKKRRRSLSTAPSVAVKQTPESLDQGSTVSDTIGERKSHNSRPHGAFVRKLPIVHSRNSRRAAKKLEQNFKNEDDSTLVEEKNPGAVQTSVVAEVIVETPTNAISIKLGQEESVLVEATRIDDGEPAGLLVEEVKAMEVSGESEVATLDDKKKNVEITETDIEVSDDESAAVGDETDLSTLTIQRLRSIAKSRGLRGYSRLRKAGLIDLLRKS